MIMLHWLSRLSLSFLNLSLRRSSTVDIKVTVTYPVVVEGPDGLYILHDGTVFKQFPSGTIETIWPGLAHLLWPPFLGRLPDGRRFLEGETSDGRRAQFIYNLCPRRAAWVIRRIVLPRLAYIKEEQRRNNDEGGNHDL